jgi:hypothetical protein
MIGAVGTVLVGIFVFKRTDFGEYFSSPLLIGFYYWTEIRLIIKPQIKNETYFTAMLSYLLS